MSAPERGREEDLPIYFVDKKSFVSKKGFFFYAIEHSAFQYIAASLKHIYPRVGRSAQKNIIVVGGESHKEKYSLSLQLREGVP